ncbi:hypothetical protein V8C40DRAFT_93333 [Trichoderma camerunense]
MEGRDLRGRAGWRGSRQVLPSILSVGSTWTSTMCLPITSFSPRGSRLTIQCLTAELDNNTATIFFVISISASFRAMKTPLPDAGLSLLLVASLEVQAPIHRCSSTRTVRACLSRYRDLHLRMSHLIRCLVRAMATSCYMVM